MNSVHISLKSLTQNIQIIRDNIPLKTKIIAVIKGEAYGHGMVGVARMFDANANVAMLAVASIDEAINLVNAGIRKKILMLNPVPVWYLETLLTPELDRREIFDHLIFSVYNLEELSALDQAACAFGGHVQVHIRLDFAGGGRGVKKSRFERLRPLLLQNYDNLTICGLYAHIYSAYYPDAEAETWRELQEYESAVESLPPEFRAQLIIHYLSSVSFFKFSSFCADAVRIGAALYGLPIGKELGLTPVMSIWGKVTCVIANGPDTLVDYSGPLSQQVHTVAIVSLGSWDAPNFFRGNVTTMSIRGRQIRLVGSPCMDSCCVDVTDHPDIRVNDDVLLLGNASGVTLIDKIHENQYQIDDCQMMFSGMDRIRRIYDEN